MLLHAAEVVRFSDSGGDRKHLRSGIELRFLFSSLLSIDCNPFKKDDLLDVSCRKPKRVNVDEDISAATVQRLLGIGRNCLTTYKASILKFTASWKALVCIEGSFHRYIFVSLCHDYSCLRMPIFSSSATVCSVLNCVPPPGEPNCGVGAICPDST